jgi:hypothetical protein
MGTNWTKFNGTPFASKARREVRVTLNKHGVIYLNSKACDLLGRPAAVEMLLEGTRQIIGLKRTDIRRTNAFHLKNHKKNAGYIRAAAFCQHFRIKPARTVLFQNVDIDNYGVMHLDLTNTVNISLGAR